MTVYNKILVPYDSSKPSEIALDHAIKIAKMSSISSAADTIVNIILLHVVKEIPSPPTFGAGLFKSKKNRRYDYIGTISKRYHTRN